VRNYFYILALITFQLQAQTAKYSNAFLNIGVDAAAFGLSNAVVAQTQDVNAIYWNPAGLTQVEDSEIALMHASYFANIAQYEHIAYARNIDDRAAFGISMIRFAVDDIMNTTQLLDANGNVDYNRISLFSAADYALNLAYARKARNEDLSYGINIKIIHRRIGNFATSFGFGVDLGFQYTKNNWNYGLMLRDISTTFNTWSFDEEQLATIQAAIPGQNQTAPETTEITLPKAQFGISRKFDLHYDNYLRPEIDLNMRFTKTHDIFSSDFVSINPAIGVAFTYHDFAFARIGLGNFQYESTFTGQNQLTMQPNVGIGFTYRGIYVDYALTNIGGQDSVMYSNVFSIKIDLEAFR
jgi:hypothetical protein